MAPWGVVGRYTTEELALAAPGSKSRGASMGSNETATTTTGGPRVIDVFYGNEAPSGPNYTLFSEADRLLEVSRG